MTIDYHLQGQYLPPIGQIRSQLEYKSRIAFDLHSSKQYLTEVLVSTRLPSIESDYRSFCEEQDNDRLLIKLIRTIGILL